MSINIKKTSGKITTFIKRANREECLKASFVITSKKMCFVIKLLLKTCANDT